MFSARGVGGTKTLYQTHPTNFNKLTPRKKLCLNFLGAFEAPKRYKKGSEKTPCKRQNIRFGAGVQTSWGRGCAKIAWPTHLGIPLPSGGGCLTEFKKASLLSTVKFIKKCPFYYSLTHPKSIQNPHCTTTTKNMHLFEEETRPHISWGSWSKCARLSLGSLLNRIPWLPWVDEMTSGNVVAVVLYAGNEFMCKHT